MARVVQQRSNPPYLLVIFVLLFVFSAAVAVLEYVQQDKSAKQEKKTADTMAKLATPQQMEGPLVKELMKNYEEGLKTNKAETVVGQMEQRVNRLTRDITGDERSTDADVQEAADKAFQAVGSRPGLAPAVLDAYSKLAAEAARTGKADERAAAAKKDLEDKEKAVQKAIADAVVERDGLNKQVADLQNQLKENQTKMEGSLAELTKENQRQTASLNQTISQQTEKILQLEKILADTQGTGTKDDHTRDANVPVVPVAKAKIVKINDDENQAYIDVGSKDRVKVGLTFTVYPSTGVTADDKAVKGNLLVTAVYPEFSICRVVKKDRNNPILPGDLLVNIAYDKNRVYRFAVVGRFDLYGTGKGTTEEAVSLIQRFGGTVVKDVTADTDYLVVGDEPPTPPKGSDDDPKPVKDAREQALKDVAKYKDSIKTAESLHVPILNANRFLALTGFEVTPVAASAE